jgi:putative membrane protein
MEPSMKRITIVAACVLLATPALAQSIGEKSGIDALFGISPSTPDFVTEVAVSDMFEIETSKLAVEKSDTATQDFAAQMITGHMKTSMELKEAVAGDPKAIIPAAMDSSHQSTIDWLTKLTGTEFNNDYHDVQVMAHKEAISLFERYAKGGDNQKLKSWAAMTLPVLQHHLMMAEALDK